MTKITRTIHVDPEFYYHLSLALERDPRRFPHPTSDGFSHSPVIARLTPYLKSLTGSGAPP